MPASWAGHTHCGLLLPQQTLPSGAPLTACCVSASLAQRLPGEQLPLEPKPTPNAAADLLPGCLQQPQPQSGHAMARNTAPIGIGNVVHTESAADLNWICGPSMGRPAAWQLQAWKSDMHSATKLLHLKRTAQKPRLRHMLTALRSGDECHLSFWDTLTETCTGMQPAQLMQQDLQPFKICLVHLKHLT